MGRDSITCRRSRSSTKHSTAGNPSHGRTDSPRRLRSPAAGPPRWASPPAWGRRPASTSRCGGWLCKRIGHLPNARLQRESGGWSIGGYLSIPPQITPNGSARLFTMVRGRCFGPWERGCAASRRPQAPTRWTSSGFAVASPPADRGTRPIPPCSSRPFPCMDHVCCFAATERVGRCVPSMPRWREPTACSWWTKRTWPDTSRA